ncbi:hypothetical protein [Ottowia testudinis]|uniref:DUF159 family protein n=1 Tax=Ottowia testudinis TaxID=2816950 RepID=A0A975CI04_9BURK|nr:hypothetical protein [Ottowia testudinis]QTD44549.1 hypothetical protein J1M35_15830 [Ottowia testudinis]
MCNRYVSPEEAEIERQWHIGGRNPVRFWDEAVFPRGRGPFIRRAVHDAGYSRELAVGQWGLIPRFAKAAKLSYSIDNARSTWTDRSTGEVHESYTMLTINADSQGRRARMLSFGRLGGVYRCLLSSHDKSHAAAVPVPKLVYARLSLVH